MTTARVSVLMTVYNASPYLREALDSLMAQTFGDWELIAVENGSTDESPQILRSYVDPRIKIFTLPKNIGRTPGLLYGAARASGEFIAVLDADDVALPERLARQVRALDENPALGMVGAWTELIDEDSRPFGMLRPSGDHAALVDQLGWTNPFVHSATTFRRAIMEQVGGYPADFIYSQDSALVIKMAAASRVAMIEEPLCRLRESPTTMTASRALRLARAEEELRFLKEGARVLPLSAGARRRNRHRQAVARLKIALVLLRSRRALEGVGLLGSVLLTSPMALIDNGRVRSAAWE
jgi:glycosyltransferase involved in cell wall biosynthesis